MTDAAATAFEPDSAVYKTLLESTKAIPWKIDWATMRFAYVGPQIEALLGWRQDSWQTVQDWAERVHPEDRERVVTFCVTQSQAGVDHEADYRALNAQGDYVWIRDVVHVVRNAAGEVEALLGFMFDISERKRDEQQLARLQQELEELSFKDGLTGIANRRRFDRMIELAWAEAGRRRRPLSLLMIDIDFFKQYNDHYGHLQGDQCLRQVAERLAAALGEGELLARFGGEEFALVLPDADAAAAQARAEQCRGQIAQAAVAHACSTVGGRLTISIGVGSWLPGPEDELRAFIDSVDRALYQAKLAGRDRVVTTAECAGTARIPAWPGWSAAAQTAAARRSLAADGTSLPLLGDARQRRAASRHGLGLLRRHGAGLA